MHNLKVSLFLLMMTAFAFSATSANTSVILSWPQGAEKCTLQISISDSVSHSIPTDSLSSRLNKKETALSATDTLTDSQRKKKHITEVCSFPFPLGFVAAHRVMLGTKPWVPVVYVATFGGCFGLLPLIDFCVILFSKDITQYENNPNIFMWLK